MPGAGSRPQLKAPAPGGSSGMPEALADRFLPKAGVTTLLREPPLAEATPPPPERPVVESARAYDRRPGTEANLCREPLPRRRSEPCSAVATYPQPKAATLPEPRSEPGGRNPPPRLPHRKCLPHPLRRRPEPEIGSRNYIPRREQRCREPEQPAVKSARAGTTSRPAAAALRNFPHCGMPELLPPLLRRAAENRSRAAPPRRRKPQPRLSRAAENRRRRPSRAAAHKKNRYRMTGIGFLFNTPEGVLVDYLPK